MRYAESKLYASNTAGKGVLMERKELTQAVVEQWITMAHGTFNVRDIWAEIGIESTQGKHHLRTILRRLEEKGLIVAVSKDGSFRKPDSTMKPIEWQSADPSRYIPFKFPFKLEDYVKVFPKSIIIVAGGKSVGKTAFLYNFVHDNMNDVDIDLYNSETGPEQMKERFDSFGDIPTPAPFKVYERYDHFADVINPDNVSVIDYLNTKSEAYECGVEIDEIFKKLRDGVALIAIQKPPAQTYMYKGQKYSQERDLGYGGAFSAFRAQLYISLSYNKVKLVYVKTPAHRTINPINMMWSFRIASDLVHFEAVERYYEKGEDE